MAQATKIGDNTTGICDLGLNCCPHSRVGTNQTGSPNVFLEGQPAHRLGDGGSIACPHGGYFQSVSASRTVIVNGHGLTRIGDSTSCVVCGQPGSHSNGCPTVFAGD